MITKTQPCPECGVVEERDSENPGLLKVHHRSRINAIGGSDCKTCAESRNKRFFDLGVKMARSQRQAVWDAILKG